MSDPRRTDEVVPWLIGLSTLGGAALGSAYVAIWVLPSLIAYYETQSTAEFPDSFVTFYFVVAAFVGAFAGTLAGVVVVVARSLFMRNRYSPGAELAGVSLGAVLSVVLSYLVFLFGGTRVAMTEYLLFNGSVAVLGLAGFTVLYRHVSGKCAQRASSSGRPEC